MRLDDFLSGVRKCPDGKLSRKFNITDNWLISANITMPILQEILLSQNNFRVHTKENDMSYLALREASKKGDETAKEVLIEIEKEWDYSQKNQLRLEYIPTSTVVRLASNINHFLYNCRVNNMGEDSNLERLKNFLERYTASLSLHPCQITHIDDVKPKRAAARANEEICNLLRMHEIPFYLPLPIGTTGDITRVVWWPDRDEEYVMREVIGK